MISPGDSPRFPNHLTTTPRLNMVSLHAATAGKLTLLLLLLLLHIALFHPSSAVPKASPSTSRSDLLDRPGPGPLSALSRVHVLQSAHICHSTATSSSSTASCPPFSAPSLLRAVRQLRRAAHDDRVRRRLQRPLYHTFVLEPFEGVVDTTILFLHPYSVSTLAFIRLI